MRKNTRTRRQRSRRQCGGNLKNRIFNAALTIKVKNGEYASLKQFIEKKLSEDPSLKIDSSILFSAMNENSTKEIVELLLQNGANPNVMDIMNQTPLHIAVDNWYNDIAILLIENGADPNGRDFHQKRPLDIAIDRNNEEMIEYLYSRTNDPNNYANMNYVENNENNEYNIENNNENNNANDLPAVSATPLGTTTIAEAPKQCFDPIMVSTTNITESDDVLTIYVRNRAGKITNSYCVDADYLTNMVQSENEVFYNCKDSVKVSALLVQPKNVQYDSPLQRIMMDIPYFTKRDQSQKMQLGKSYVFQETDTPVGRVASRSVVKGGSVVSAKHCGPDEPGNMYEILEVVKTGGRRKTRRNRKH
jgi:hypothetical protein